MIFTAETTDDYVLLQADVATWRALVERRGAEVQPLRHIITQATQQQEAHAVVRVKLTPAQARIVLATAQ